MKRFLLGVIAVAICFSFVACGPKDSAQTEKPSETSPKNTAPSAPSGNDAHTDSDVPADASAMRKIAGAMEATGLFGDSMELHVTGDEYAADILEFTYGLAPNEHHIADYIISEQTSKQAYSFAFITFENGVKDEDISAVKSALENVYLADLKSALEVYNPEAYAMCDHALIEHGMADIPHGDTSRPADFVVLIVSDSNSDAKTALTDALSK